MFTSLGSPLFILMFLVSFVVYSFKVPGLSFVCFCVSGLIYFAKQNCYNVHESNFTQEQVLVIPDQYCVRVYTRTYKELIRHSGQGNWGMLAVYSSKCLKSKCLKSAVNLQGFHWEGCMRLGPSHRASQRNPSKFTADSKHFIHFSTFSLLDMGS